MRLLQMFAAVAMLAFSFQLAVCQSVESSSREGQGDDPIFVVFADETQRRHAPVDLDGKDEWWKRHRSLQIAVWADGFVLCARGWDTPGLSIQAGWMDEAEVERLKGQLRSFGAFDVAHQEYLTAVAARSWVIGCREGDQTNAFFWNELIHPGVSWARNPTPEYLEFVQLWTTLRVLACSMRPNELKDARLLADEAGDCRGYDFDEPWRTPWIDACRRTWRHADEGDSGQ